MDMQWAKMADELLLRFEAYVDKVLVAEHQGASLRSEESELVQAGTVELGELHAVNLRSDMRRQIPHLCHILEQVGQLGICSMTGVDVLEGTDVFYFLKRIVECCGRKSLSAVGTGQSRPRTYACIRGIVDRHCRSFVG